MSLQGRLNRLLAKMPETADPIEFVCCIDGLDPEPLPGKNRWIEIKSYSDDDLNKIRSERAENAKIE